jgi:hypothetical protein
MMISRKMRWAGCLSVTGKRELLTEFWGRNLKGKVPFGRPGHRWEVKRNRDIDVV